MSDQPELLQPEHLPPRVKWEKLFSFLPLPADPQPKGRGRPPTPPSVVLKALIYQRLARLQFLRQLHTQLLENPSIWAALGADPYRKPLEFPDHARFIRTFVPYVFGNG